MRIDFRQGIITYPSSGQIQTFLQYSGGFVSLSCANGRVDVAFAQSSANYLLTESVDVPNAWGILASGVDYWLYWDIDLRTAVRTFGSTTLLPIISSTQPATTEGQHWFNPVTNTMSVASSGTYRPVLRVFAAKIRDGVFTPLGSGVASKPFAGTQVGVTLTDTRVGRILVDNTGSPIRRFDGNFFTTETDFFIGSSPVIAASLEGSIVTATAVTVLPKFHVVKFTEFGKINLASYADIQTSTIALLTENLTINQVGSVVLQGYVTNPDWNWSTLSTLWINNTGVLIEQDPHKTDPFTYPNPNPPVARVVSPTSIIFDQGLGGIGEKGDGAGPATTTVAGAILLNIPAVNQLAPIVVGVNDPRLTDARTPLTHNQAATTVIPTAYGALTGANLQVTLQQVEDNKVSKTGGTMTGALVLNANPTVALGAATKQYVDAFAGTTNKISQLDSSLTVTDTGTNGQLELLLDNESKLKFTTNALTVQRPTNANSWVAVMGDDSAATLPNTEFDPSAVTIDSVGNTIVLGTDSAGFIRVVKTSPVGAAVWQLTLEVSGDFPTGSDIATDSLNNIYVSADYAGGVAIVKLSSTGVILWQKQLSAGVTYYLRPAKIIVDGSDNLIIASSDSSAGIVLIKLSTVGTVVWANVYGTVALDNFNIEDVTVDSLDGSIYVVGNSGSGIVLKFSSAGALIWNVNFLFTDLASTINIAVGVGALGVYVAAYGGTGNTSVVYRINKSDGAVNWANSLLANTFPIKITSLVVDSSGSEKIILHAVKIFTREYGYDTLLAAISGGGSLLWASQVGSFIHDDSSQLTVAHRLLSYRSGYIVGIAGYDPLNQRLANTWAYHIPSDGSYQSAIATTLHFNIATVALTTAPQTSTVRVINSVAYTETMPTPLFVVASSTIPVTYAPAVIPITTSADALSSSILLTNTLSVTNIIAPFIKTTETNAGYGRDILYNITTGTDNTAIGHQSMYSTTTGTSNTAAGYKSLWYQTTGYQNTAIGHQSMLFNTTGFTNVAVGVNSLYANVSGYTNTASGVSALEGNTDGYGNTAVGYHSLRLNTLGNNNTATGKQALLFNTTASFNTANGFSALNSNTTGGGNTAVGYYSSFANTTGGGNVAVGQNALKTVTTASFNTAIGQGSLEFNTGGSNIGVGYTSGSAITTGSFNVILGSNTGSTIATQSNNIIISDGAGNIRIQVDSTHAISAGPSASAVSTASIAMGQGAYAAGTSNNTTIGGTTNSINGGVSNVILGGASNSNNGGARSVILGGVSNSLTSTGFNNIILGGSGNTTSGIVLNTVAMGTAAKPFVDGSFVQGNTAGAQAGTIVVSVVTPGAAVTTLTVEGATSAATQFISLPLDSTLTFDALIVARRTDVDGESAAYQLTGCIKQDGTAASTALVGVVNKVVIAETTVAWDVTATADATNGRLSIRVTGEAAKTIQWNAHVRYVMATG